MKNKQKCKRPCCAKSPDFELICIKHPQSQEILRSRLAENDFKWNKLNYDYNIETTRDFDNFYKKELLLLSTLHCINYYMTIVVTQ